MAHATAPNLSDREKQRLTKQVAPVNSQALNLFGQDILQKNDPVLLYLALSDEREYERMIQTDVAISGAIEQRVNGLVSQGYDIVVGRSDSTEARRNADFVEEVLAQLPRFGTLRREVMRSTYYGWRPVWLGWRPDFEFDGRPYLAINEARAKKPWEYEFTVGGDLLYTGGIRAEVVSDGIDKLHWMFCTAGSTDNPYGESWLRRLWMLFFLSKKFEKMSAQAMQRSLGIIKAKQGGIPAIGGLAGTGAVKEAKVVAEIQQVMDRLNQHNVLLELQGWSLDFVTDVAVTEAHEKMVTMFDTKKRQAIVLQNLTSDIRGFGSRAAAEVHKEILRSVWISDATEESDWYTEGLIKPLLEVNFGEQLGKNLPVFKSRVFTRPSMEETKAAFEMGLPIDGRRLATSWRVPVVLPDDDSDVVLEKQESTVFGLSPTGKPSGTQDDPNEDDGDDPPE